MRNAAATEVARGRTGTVARCDARLALAAGLVVAAAALGPAQTAPLALRAGTLHAGDRPAYLFGQGFWHAVVKDGFDTAAEARWYRPFGANLTRIKTVTTRILPSRDHAPLNPWVRLSHGRYDLGTFDEAFWKRLDDTLRQNEQEGRYVLLQIFDEVTMKAGTDQWDRHPLCSANNVNDLGTPGLGQRGPPAVYDLDNAKLKDVHRAYIRRLLAATYRYRHVIYEVCNEYGGTREFLFWVLDLIAAFEKEHEVDLPVTNMSVTPALFADESAHDAVDLLDCWHAPYPIRTLSLEALYGCVTSLRANHAKPVLAGRIGLEPDITNGTPHFRRVARAQLWAILMAGGIGATTKEDYPGIENGPAAYDVDDEWEGLGFLGLHCVLDNLQHRGPLVPRADRAINRPFTHTWAASVGPETLVYLVDVSGPGGGTLHLRNLPDGPCTVKVYAPDPGQTVRVDRVQVSGGTASIPIDPVSVGDRVVWLTPEPMDVTARWEESQGRRRSVIELRDPRPLLGSHLALNGVDITPLVPHLYRISFLPGGGVRLASAWVTWPPGVHEVAVRVWGPSAADRSIMRMWVR